MTHWSTWSDSKQIARAIVFEAREEAASHPQRIFDRIIRSKVAMVPETRREAVQVCVFDLLMTTLAVAAERQGYLS